MNKPLTPSSQQQSQSKQLLLNNFIDTLLELKQYGTSSSTKRPKQVNYMQLFDLLIWVQKKRPQLLMNVMEMDIILIAFNLLDGEQMQKQVKAFILLINNCKVNGELIAYLLANNLIDFIIKKYLNSIKKNKQLHHSLQEELEYLGSLLKAINNHLNQKTYPYFINKKQPSQQEISIIQEKKKHYLEESICDPDDIFNTCDKMLEVQHKKEQDKESQEGQEKQCLFLKVCTRFYNCPQQLTKTTVMTIVMSILRQPFAKELIYSKKTNQPHPYMEQWSYNLCSQFRNQLKNFNQQLLVLLPSQQQLYVQQINDKLILWQDLTQTQFKQIYRQNFMSLVIYALIIGSLNTLSLPMFNVKFTFFVLGKLMKVCANLSLLKQLAQILFLKQQIHYNQNWVSTAVLKGFDLRQLLNDSYYENDSHKYEKQQANTFEGVSDFFFNMLKSKDQHFLQVSSCLLQQLIHNVRKDHQLSLKFNSQLGFEHQGRNLVAVTSIFINQLRFDHTLKLQKRVCETLVYLNSDKKRLSQDNSNEFLFFYGEYLSQTLDLIDKGEKHWNYIVETFQYDMKILDFMKFVPKVVKDVDLLFHPLERDQEEINSQNSLNTSFSIPSSKDINLKESSSFAYLSQKNLGRSFYSSIPQTPSEILRYRIVKTFMLLKFKETMFQTRPEDCILSRYVQKLKQWEQKQLKPGFKLQYPIKQKFHQCKVIEDKTQIPCMVIEDDVNLIIGFVQPKDVKIIINAKLKHVQTQLISKKDKTFIKLNIKKFDYTSQNLVHKCSLTIKGFSTGIQYIAIKRENFKEKELNSIRRGLKKTVQNLPEISLL